MQAAILPAELRAAAPAFAARLAVLLAGLVALIARAFYRNPRRFPLILPLCLWLQRTRNRVARVMQKLEAGTLRVRNPRPSRKSSGKRPLALPRQRAWLLTDLKHEGAYYALRLEALLAEPDIAALISTTPQAQRLLRPLCHILGVRHASLGMRHASLGVRHASLGIKPKALNLPLPRAGLGCEADQRRGLSRSDGKGELRASTRALGAQPQLTSPPLLVGLGCKADQRRGEGWQPHEPSGLSPPPDPYANLCPRLRTRWPFNQLPQFRQA